MLCMIMLVTTEVIVTSNYGSNQYSVLESIVFQYSSVDIRGCNDILKCWMLG